jgi:hypothetical protein
LRRLQVVAVTFQPESAFVGAGVADG